VRASIEELEELAARIIAEGPVRVAEVARRCPADRGRRGHVSADAVVRWIRHGRRGVRLEGCRLSGKGWCSSWPALARFSAALEAAAGGTAAVVAPQQRERRARGAAAELDALRGHRQRPR